MRLTHEAVLGSSSNDQRLDRTFATSCWSSESARRPTITAASWRCSLTSAA